MLSLFKKSNVDIVSKKTKYPLAATLPEDIASILPLESFTLGDFYLTAHFQEDFYVRLLRERAQAAQE